MGFLVKMGCSAAGTRSGVSPPCPPALPPSPGPSPGRRWFPVALVVLGVVWALAGPAAGGDPAEPDDPLFDRQWALEAIDAPGAWAVTRGAGVTVAVIDSGAALDHPDLAGAVLASTDCTGASGDPAACRDGAGLDDDGHGTHVTGIVAARAGNGTGVVGVAPEASVLVVRALRHVCPPAEVPATPPACHAVGTVDDTVAAMRWAVDHGADVVNLSVADDPSSRVGGTSPLAEEIRRTWEAGVIVVVASGNDLDLADPDGFSGLPAVVVTATGPDGDKPAYANSVGGALWALAAPGGDGSGVCPDRDIVSTYWRPGGPPDDVACLAGTSMAAPHVTGVLALLRAAGASPAEAVQIALATATDVGDPGRDRRFGYGLVDAAAAVHALRTGPGAADVPVEDPPAAPVVSAVGGGGPSPPAPAPGATPSPAPRAPEVTGPGGGPGEGPAEPSVVVPPRGQAAPEVPAPGRAHPGAVVAAVIALAAAMTATLRRVRPPVA